jgi:hypothetical protein
VEPAPSPLELIARRFPGWHIWRGTDSGGHPTGWHATRRERLTRAERAAGLLATVAVGDAGTLIERIEEQESLARGTELEDL